MSAKSHKHYRLWGIVLLLAVLSGVVFLTLRALEENIIFFYSPNELQTLSEKPRVTFRLGGLVTGGSYLLRESGANPLHQFSLEDGAAHITTLYRGILPDLFREGQGIIGLGHWDQQREIFIAEELLAKHDENYMPAEITDALKKTGHWKDVPE